MPLIHLALVSRLPSVPNGADVENRAAAVSLGQHLVLQLPDVSADEDAGVRHVAANLIAHVDGTSYLTEDLASLAEASSGTTSR